MHRILGLNSKGLQLSTKENYKNARQKDVGHEFWNSGYLWVKVNQGVKNKKDNYIQKHRYIWEQYHGKKVPDGHLIMFLDGNKENFSIDNLVCVSFHENGSLNQLHDCSPELKKCKLASVKLSKILSELDV